MEYAENAYEAISLIHIIIQRWCEIPISHPLKPESFPANRGKGFPQRKVRDGNLAPANRRGPSGPGAVASYQIAPHVTSKARGYEPRTLRRRQCLRAESRAAWRAGSL